MGNFDLENFSLIKLIDDNFNISAILDSFSFADLFDKLLGLFIKALDLFR